MCLAALRSVQFHCGRAFWRFFVSPLAAGWRYSSSEIRSSVRWIEIPNVKRSEADTRRRRLGLSGLSSESPYRSSFNLTCEKRRVKAGRAALRTFTHILTRQTGPSLLLRFLALYRDDLLLLYYTQSTRRRQPIHFICISTFHDSCNKRDTVLIYYAAFFLYVLLTA